MTEKTDKEEKLYITSPYEGYETRYPELLVLSNRQLEEQIWFASEIRVEEEDKLEMLYKLDEQQQRVVKAILPMFRKYEDDVARFWTDVYAKYFLAPESQEGALVIAMIERAVHERFYDKINKVFGLDNDESYLSYLTDPVFKERSKWLGETLRNEDKHLVCLVFGLVEGVSLFSMFALLRSFQANGYNLISTTVKGTKQSSIDELLHSEYLARSFQYLYDERGENLEKDDKYYYDLLMEQTKNVVENEKYILTQLIGESHVFNGVKIEDYFSLIEKLADLYFERLGCETLPYNVGDCPLYSWFITNSVAYAEPDFFGKGKNKEYEMSWDADSFKGVWKK
jgi:hypothetical protein